MAVPEGEHGAVLDALDGLVAPAPGAGRRQLDEADWARYEGYVSEKYGPVTTLDASAILLGDRLSTFLVNRSLTEALEVQVNLADRRVRSLESAEVVAGSDPKAENTYENPNAVMARSFDDGCIKDGVAFLKLPPLATVAATFILES